MMKKKGISPLIATVLIIGFTIVLAALVITWGGDLFKGIQEETGKTAQMSTTCSYLLTGVDVKSAGVKTTAGEYYVLVDNNNPQGVEIDTVDLKLYNAAGEAEICSSTSGVAAGAATKVSCNKLATAFPTGFGSPTEIGVYAYVEVGDEGDTAKCTQELGRAKIESISA